MEFRNRMEIVINYYKEENVNIFNQKMDNKLDEFTPIMPETKTSKKEYISKPCKNLEKLFSHKKRK